MALNALTSNDDNKSTTIGTATETLTIPDKTGRLDVLFRTNSGEFSKDGGTSWFFLPADSLVSFRVLGVNSLLFRASVASTQFDYASWPRAEF